MKGPDLGWTKLRLTGKFREGILICTHFGIKSGKGTSFPARQETDSISLRHFSVLARLGEGPFSSVT